MQKRREAFLKKAKRQTNEALRSRDILLAHAARSIDELNKVLNRLNERLNETMGLYYPEFRTMDGKKLAEQTMQLDLSSATQRELEEKDVKACQALASRILDLYRLGEEYEKYQNELAQETCPNIAHVAGADIAAKLVAHTGSLSRLAVLPSSVIQVLGAEKALFKHLKNRRIAPPKHGILFQHPWISGSPKTVRGKIARALANKIAMAAKADGFTKNFIAEALKKDLEARYKEIMEQYEKGKKV